MLAFMDAEYNSDKDYKRNCEDQSLIEVTVLITDDHAKTVAEIYHNYVIPILHDGKIYSRIKKMTGIRQEDVDAGISFIEVIEDIYSLLNRYEVKNIFTYGDDMVAFKWNKKQYEKVPYSKKVISKIKDISGSLRQLCGIKRDVSLDTFAYICGTKFRVTHSASDDVETLREVYMSVMEGKYDRKKCSEFNRHALNRERYYQMRENLRVMEQTGMKKEEIFEMLREGRSFPKFVMEEENGEKR